MVLQFGQTRSEAILDKPKKDSNIAELFDILLNELTSITNQLFIDS